MKHMKQLLFLMVLLAGARAFGQANYTTGDELRENCKYAVSDSDADHAMARAGFCIGFIDGFQQFEQLVDISQGANDANSSARLICTPDGVTNRQNVKVVVKYLDRHPEFLHKFAALLVLEAMQEAFPCPKARNK